VPASFLHLNANEVDALLADVRRRKATRQPPPLMSPPPPRHEHDHRALVPSIAARGGEPPQELAADAPAPLLSRAAPAGERAATAAETRPRLGSEAELDATLSAVAACTDRAAIAAMLAQVRRARAASPSTSPAQSVPSPERAQSRVQPSATYDAARAGAKAPLAADSARGARAAADPAAEQRTPPDTASAALDPLLVLDGGPNTTGRQPALDPLLTRAELQRSLEMILAGSSDVFAATRLDCAAYNARRAADSMDSDGARQADAADARVELKAPTPKQAKEIVRLRALLKAIDITPLLDGMRRTPRPPPLIERATRSQFERSIRVQLDIDGEAFEDRGRAAAVRRFFTTIALFCVAPDAPVAPSMRGGGGGESEPAAAEDLGETEGKRFEPLSIPFSAVVAALALPCVGSGSSCGGGADARTTSDSDAIHVSERRAERAVVQSVLDAFGSVDADFVPTLTQEVSVLLFIVTFYANLAHSLTRSP
jgi:hypothetical protein